MVDWAHYPSLDGVQFWIFDDFPAERVKLNYKQFMGGQREFPVTDKYLRKRWIVNCGPAIYLFNTPEFDSLYRVLDMGWVEENCAIININNKLY